MSAVAALLLVVAVADGQDVRLASAGTGSEDVVWLHDGLEVARTRDGEAATLRLGPGTHELHASTTSRAAWVAMARADGSEPGLGYEPAWVARADAAPAQGKAWLWPAALAACAVALGAGWRRRPAGRAELAVPEQDGEEGGPGWRGHARRRLRALAAPVHSLGAAAARGARAVQALAARARRTPPYDDARLDAGAPAGAGGLGRADP